MRLKPKYGPKPADHPTIGKSCPACTKVFEEGDYTTLVVVGPGDDREAQRKAALGLTYEAVALEVHYACAGGQ